MSIIVKRILNCQRSNVRKLVNVRICDQLNHVSYSNNEWNRRTFIAFQQFPEEYKKHLMYRKCTNIASNEKIPEHPNRKNTEHSQMHSLLQNSMYYRNTIVPSIKSTFIVTAEEIKNITNMDWSAETPDNCIYALKKIAHYHLNGSRLEEQTYEYIIANLTKKLPELNNKQIQMLMQYLIVITSRISDSLYRSFVKALDKECLKRFFSADINQLLYTIDAFYQLKMYSSAFMWRGLRKIGSRLYKLNGKNMVQFLFYLSLCTVPDLEMYEIEHHFFENVIDVTPDEVGIACRGFFLSKRRIKNKALLAKMMNIVTNNIERMHDFTIAAFMKEVRYSENCYDTEKLVKLLTKVKSIVENIQSLHTLTHIAHIMGATRVYDPILMKHIVQRLDNEFSSARLKDIERIIYAVCVITPVSEYHDTCNKFLNLLLSSYQTTRAEEISQFPKNFFRCVLYLSYKKIFSEELIRHVLDPMFVKNAYKYSLKLLTNDFLSLHCTIQIELPHYTGPLLSDDIYKCLVEQFCRKSELRGKFPLVKFRTEVIQSCKELLGTDICIDYILPHHFFPDVVFGFDEQNKLVPIASILSEMPNGSIKTVPREHLQTIKWKVIVPLNSNSVVPEHGGYIGPTYTRLRQLQMIGYTPIPVNKDIWQTLDTCDRTHYLKELIYEQEPTDYLKE
ncbi:uncharacterized protein LOC117229521 isoform X1 [Megalopta genalis]|uniref:uncharacterized protein LOC117229521 isoform X1 n=2 Tax=Megalopta genalis TaxID=115081 RepID=UPI003FD05C6A